MHPTGSCLLTLPLLSLLTASGTAVQSSTAAVAACAANDFVACVELSHMYRLGEVSGWIDLGSAADAWQKGAKSGGIPIETRRMQCDEADAVACYVLAHAYLSGWGIGKDDKMAFRSFALFCSTLLDNQSLILDPCLALQQSA